MHKPLLGINFFLGDVGAGLGPYLAIYLMSILQWDPGKIGVALAITSIATVIMQTPAGGFVDTTHRKRLLLIACAVIIALSTVTIALNNTPWIIYLCQVLIGAAAAFLGPTIAGITLGIVGSRRFTRQTSANQAWNHGGNVFAAIISAVLALWVSALGVFWLVAIMAVGLIICTLLIDPREINHERARGAIAQSQEENKQPSGLKVLLHDRRLMIFAFSILLFHFANAAMLPLVSQKLSSGSNAEQGIAFTSACIITAQFVMIFMAIFCGRKADTWGRKPLFLIAFAILPIRAILFSLTDTSVYLVMIQALDGVANGIFGVLFLLIVADLTKGSGRFNIVQGALATLLGIGVSLSNLIAEQIVEISNFDTGFLFLGAVGLVGLFVFAVFMPETLDKTTEPNVSVETELS
ncbi:MFS transporter [Shewanella surugensis]|uniref:MFS transporter n=1 Tax=Shewanella surugensis TaxID=212020 RepID=A0ABT0LCE6_9GAMM|nr:MFS transporter [Shewanella surugensis]MCL1125022.1 MFS transporter [Shewanella surugensis]